MQRRVRVIVLVGLVALIAACGGGGGSDDDEAKPEATEAEDAGTDGEAGLSRGLRSELRGLAESSGDVESAAGVDVDIVDSYTDYKVVSDVTGAVQVSVPVEWTEVSGDLGFVADDGTGFGNGLEASTDLAGFNETWGYPGVQVIASSTTTSTLGEILAEFGEVDECTSDGIQDYADEVYTGLVEVWTGCAGTETEWVVIAALPPDESYLVVVGFQLVSDADVDALDQVIASFEVVGTLSS
jgi:serine protease Do